MGFLVAKIAPISYSRRHQAFGKGRPMRNTLQLGILWVVSLGLMAPAAQILVAQNAPKAEKPGAISGAGCVEAGVEAGCLVLRDTKTGTLYNLFVTGKKPPVGTGIRVQRNGSRWTDDVHAGKARQRQRKRLETDQTGV
jgi:hypothetical protein